MYIVAFEFDLRLLLSFEKFKLNERYEKNLCTKYYKILFLQQLRLNVWTFFKWMNFGLLPYFSKLVCRELKKVENHWVKEIVCYPSGDFLSCCLLIHILRSDIHLSDSNDDQHYQNLENKIDFI